MQAGFARRRGGGPPRKHYLSARASRPRRRPGATPQRRLSASRQRQRLIDACISALHIYGPSQTTVAKVVAIAKLSPGIVRFYFKSKGAMLVASLRFLSTEFEQLVLEPVGSLRHAPVQALQTLVDLYLDAAVASTRKVSVWYAFWGEATARQEYQDICGQKDDRFADLVLELIGRMIEKSGQAHLDPDAISLGLIGVLEMIWQGFAFQTEERIDRSAARARALAYLASVFPGHFPSRLPARGWDGLAVEQRFEQERARWFGAAWQLAGHEAELRSPGDSLTVELATGRVLVLRDAARLRALDNSCPPQPHALVLARRSQLGQSISCPLHQLCFALDGRAADPAASGNLAAVHQATSAGLVFVCATAEGDVPLPPDLSESAPHPAQPGPGVNDSGTFSELEVAADWKVAVEQLLLHRLSAHPVHGGVHSFDAPALESDPDRRQLRWRAQPAAGSAGTTLRLGPAAQARDGAGWRRIFLWPNILLEWRPDGISAIQVIPVAPGRSRWQCFDYWFADGAQDATAARLLAGRIGREALRLDLDLAASTQRGLAAPGYRAVPHAAAPPAVAAFRQFLDASLP